MYDIDDFIQKMHQFGLLWHQIGTPSFIHNYSYHMIEKAPCSPMFLGKKTMEFAVNVRFNQSIDS